MTRTIAINLKKGGVGKTTTAINLAAEINKRGHKVLLVDTDPQANATISCGVDAETSSILSICDLFENTKINPKDAITKTPFGLDIMPSHPNLSKVVRFMTTSNVGELKALLRPLEPDYDFIVIDTAPSESFLNLAVLAYVIEVILPVQTHFLSLQGLKQTLEIITGVQAELNPGLKILGILPTKAHARTNMNIEALRNLNEKFGELVFPLTIDFTIKHPEASVKGTPLVILDPKHRGSIAYQKLADLILGVEKRT